MIYQSKFYGKNRISGMEKSFIIENLPKVRGQYRIDFDLSPITWFKVGGKADVLYKPEDLEDLQFFLKNLDREIPVTILGNCSNIIVRDKGVAGVVIKLGRNFANTQIKDSVIITGAACLNSTVANYALANSITGLEFLIGIPGSIGGGIKMNAGAYGSEFKNVLISIKALDRSGNIINFDIDETNFTYRNCNLEESLIFVEASFKAKKGDAAIIKENMLSINTKRAESQPIKEKTGGSTFANPEGYSSWKLIDQAGLRGYRIGDAQFSEKHCNFMINTGSAKAEDLENLGELAIKKVQDASGIKLKWEIKRIGRK
jgi:UDP-N-acetylmuramate dehydrogenase